MPMFNPPHPGGTLKEALESIPMSVTEFAKHIGVARGTLSRILNERAGFTPEMSLRVSEALGQGSSGIWFRMQTTHDFWQAEHSKKRKKVEPLKNLKVPMAA